MTVNKLNAETPKTTPLLSSESVVAPSVPVLPGVPAEVVVKLSLEVEAELADVEAELVDVEAVEATVPVRFQIFRILIMYYLMRLLLLVTNRMEDHCKDCCCKFGQYSKQIHRLWLKIRLSDLEKITCSNIECTLNRTRRHRVNNVIEFGSWIILDPSCGNVAHVSSPRGFKVTHDVRNIYIS